MEENYYNTSESVKEYIKLSVGFSGKALIDKLKPLLAPTSIVLELGSGPGKDWLLLNECFSTIGSDSSLEFLDHLNRTYPTGEFVHLDASKFALPNKVDAIYSNKVLHHLTDLELESSIRSQYDQLSEDGIICHSFWKGNGDETFKGLFVNYHTLKGLHNLFNPTFDILLTEEYKEFEENDSILLIAKKKV